MIPINTLLEAYRTGLFPMSIGGRIHWFSPEQRGILPLDSFHVSRRMRRILRQGRFQVTINMAFREVIYACASRQDDSGNWIDEEILESYSYMHNSGFAHSIEVWQAKQLVGGLYGVSLRGAFFGESMFHRTNNASKVALCTLVERLTKQGYRLLDLQWLTPHLAGLGAVEVPRQDYLRMLTNAMEINCIFAEQNNPSRSR